MITFIGDVHGWPDRLERVLARSEGPLLFVGDLIDRGPDAPAVLARVRELCEAGRARCLMGNHEFALVRGLGVPELGIPADAELFAAWAERYGGDAVLGAYDLSDADPEALRLRLGSHLAWMAQLPWLLGGADDDGAHAWMAVHAGLPSRDWRREAADIAAPMALMQRADRHMPPSLYAKIRAFIVPDDFSERTLLVSGHTPQPAVYQRGQRLLCDTSGGLPGRPLSAVEWPTGRVIASD